MPSSYACCGSYPPLSNRSVNVVTRLLKVLRLAGQTYELLKTHAKAAVDDERITQIERLHREGRLTLAESDSLMRRLQLLHVERKLSVGNRITRIVECFDQDLEAPGFVSDVQMKGILELLGRMSRERPGEPGGDYATRIRAIANEYTNEQLMDPDRSHSPTESDASDGVLTYTTRGFSSASARILLDEWRRAWGRTGEDSGVVAARSGSSDDLGGREHVDYKAFIHYLTRGQLWGDDEEHLVETIAPARQKLDFFGKRGCYVQCPPCCGMFEGRCFKDFLRVLISGSLFIVSLLFFLRVIPGAGPPGSGFFSSSQCSDLRLWLLLLTTDVFCVVSIVFLGTLLRPLCCDDRHGDGNCWKAMNQSYFCRMLLAILVVINGLCLAMWFLFGNGVAYVMAIDGNGETCAGLWYTAVALMLAVWVTQLATCSSFVFAWCRAREEGRHDRPRSSSYSTPAKLPATRTTWRSRVFKSNTQKNLTKSRSYRDEATPRDPLMRSPGAKKPSALPR